MLSPFFACVFRSAKMRSCLRIRFAPSISIEFAMSSSSETCLALSSDRCMARAGTAGGGRFGRMDESGFVLAPRREGGAWNMAGAVGARRTGASARRPATRGAYRGYCGLSRNGSEVAVEKRRQLRFRQRADLLRMDLAAFVQDDRRDAADAELAGGGRIGVDVELGDRQLALVGLGDLVQDRREHLAGTAPFGPEIDEYRVLRLKHILFERRIRYVLDEFAHRKSFPCEVVFEAPRGAGRRLVEREFTARHWCRPSRRWGAI